MDLKENVSSHDALQTTTVDTELNLEISTSTIKKETVECTDQEESPVNDNMYPSETLETTEYVNHYDSKNYVLEQVKKEVPEEECHPAGGSAKNKIVTENKISSKHIAEKKLKSENIDEQTFVNIKQEDEDKMYEIATKEERLEEQTTLDNSGNADTDYDPLLVPRKIQCSLSGRQFGNYNSLEHNNEFIEVEINTPGFDELYKCHFCDKHFDTYGNMLAHITDDHKKTKPIFELCGKQFKKEQNVGDDFVFLHKTKKSPKCVRKNSVKCKYCNTDFKHKYKLNEHMKLCHPGKEDKEIVYKCDTCERVFKKRGSLTLHRNKMHNDYGRLYDCWCGKQFSSHIELRLHRKLQHNIVIKKDINNDKLQCSSCHKYFKSKPSLALHIRKIHYDYGKVFECLCGKQFRSPIYLKEHKKLHERTQNTDKAKYQCDSCEKVFKRKANLLVHIKRFHYDYGRLFECSCGEQFCSPILLNQHRRRRHDLKIPIANRFQCDSCQKLFKTKPCLIAHIKRMHYDYGRTFECWCGYQYRSPIQLQEHERMRHYPKVDRNNVKFQCDSCKKFFKAKQSLVEHIKRFHNDHEKLVECWCGEEFRSQMELSEHKEAEHVVSFGGFKFRF